MSLSLHVLQFDYCHLKSMLDFIDFFIKLVT